VQLRGETVPQTGLRPIGKDISPCMCAEVSGVCGAGTLGAPAAAAAARKQPMTSGSNNRQRAKSTGAQKNRKDLLPVTTLGTESVESWRSVCEQVLEGKMSMGTGRAKTQGRFHCQKLFHSMLRVCIGSKRVCFREDTVRFFGNRIRFFEKWVCFLERRV